MQTVTPSQAAMHARWKAARSNIRAAEEAAARRADARLTARTAIPKPEKPKFGFRQVPQWQKPKIIEGLPAHWRPIAAVKQSVAMVFGVTVKEMHSPSRLSRLTLARQVAMYLAKSDCRASFPEIGRRFGGRDHTTALHAFYKVKELLPTDPDLAAKVAAVRELLGAAA